MSTKLFFLFALVASALAMVTVRAEQEMPEDMFDEEFGGEDFDGVMMARADNNNAGGNKQQKGGNPPPQDNSGGDKQCSLGKKCFNNGECGGTEGDKSGPQCFGALVGKCDCAACITGLPCSDDSKCGGLEGACAIGDKPISQARADGDKIPAQGKCACLQMAQRKLNETNFPDGQKKPTLAQAINDFCTKANPACSPSACFGMPCHAGVCTNCAAKAKAPAPAAPAKGAKAPAPGASAAPAPAAGGDDPAAAPAPES